MLFYTVLKNEMDMTGKFHYQVTEDDAFISFFFTIRSDLCREVVQGIDLIWTT